MSDHNTETMRKLAKCERCGGWTTGDGCRCNDRDCQYGRQIGKCADCDLERMEPAFEAMRQALHDIRLFVHVDCPVSDYGDNLCTELCIKVRAALALADKVSR